MSTTLEEVAATLGESRRQGEELLYHCPRHEDRDPSLSVNLRKRVWTCFPCKANGKQASGKTGWSLAAFAAGVDPNDKRAVKSWLGSHGIATRNGNGLPSAVYVYQDEAGRPVFRVKRFAKPGGSKTFVQERYHDGRWLSGVTGRDESGGSIRLIRNLPYRLREVIKAESVFVVEGEKDCETLRRLNLFATTNAGGAGKWPDEFAHWLKNKRVAILPDNDEPGRNHAWQVARTLLPLARSVRLLELPGLPAKGDVTDWVAQGHTRSELLGIVGKTPDLKPEDLPPVRTDPLPYAMSSKRWPTLDPAALHGLVGDIVRLIEAATEADPTAILIQFLVCFGNVIGRQTHWTVEADRHYLNLFVCLVGESAKARKGTSFRHVRRLFSQVDEGWERDRIQSGLSSGEGLIWAVRDPIETSRRKTSSRAEHEVASDDQGISDKRLLADATEFASVLKLMSREGNTLSPTIRNAWDSGDLQTLTKNSPARATGAHISIIGHITRDELLRHLDTTEAGNGFANRFLWVCVRRSKLLPEGGRIDQATEAALVERLRQSVSFGRTAGHLVRDPDAALLWSEAYFDLNEEKPGLLGCMIARSEAQAMRLAAIYAVLDRTTAIRPEHLKAGLAVWRYCEDSARFIFGDSLGDPIADELLTALKEAGPQGMSRTRISEYFGRNKNAGQIGRALAGLIEQNLVRPEVESKAAGLPGRPVERFVFALYRLTKETN